MTVTMPPGDPNLRVANFVDNGSRYNRAPARIVGWAFAALRFTFRDSFLMQALLTCVLAGIGGTFLLPPDQFALPIFGWFAVSWPYTETGWGLVFCALALCGVVGLVFRHRVCKLVSVMLLAIGHIVYAEGLVNGGAIGPGRWTYSFLAMAALLLVGKIGQEGRR
jgi:hypothetical protein